MKKKEPFVRLLLDSGAYTAWTMQRPIKVKEYIKFVKENSQFIWNAICLDVLPGEFGKKRSDRDVKIAAAASYKNLQAMKEAGLKPIPVFHRGESFEWLEKMLRDGETYIGLSPLVDSMEAEKRVWLDKCFSVITDSKGNALVKTHGFGVTNPTLMMRYPWHSVDSTSWVKSGGFGIIYVPVYEKGVPNFRRRPIRVHISEVDKTTADSFKKLGPTAQECVLTFLDEHGFSLPEITYSRAKRCAAMLRYFNGLEKVLPINPPLNGFRQSGFIKDAEWTISPDDFRITDKKFRKELTSMFYVFHSTNLSNDQGQLLTEAKVRSRLLSYMELRDLPPERLSVYVKDGMDLDYVRRQPPRRWNGRGYTTFRRMRLIPRVNRTETPPWND